MDIHLGEVTHLFVRMQSLFLSFPSLFAKPRSQVLSISLLVLNSFFPGLVGWSAGMPAYLEKPQSRTLMYPWSQGTWKNKRYVLTKVPHRRRLFLQPILLIGPQSWPIPSRVGAQSRASCTPQMTRSQRKPSGMIPKTSKSSHLWVTTLHGSGVVDCRIITIIPP